MNTHLLGTTMRKRIIGQAHRSTPPEERPWLNVDQLAEVEVTSEDVSYPIDNALTPGRLMGWRASSTGEQTIRVLFDEPQAIRHVQILFTEAQHERKQEFTLGWATEESHPLREIVRQQFHFSPQGAVRELEDYKVELDEVRVIELKVNPDRDGGPSRASLDRLYFS
jgi:hypothetical protein